MHVPFGVANQPKQGGLANPRTGRQRSGQVSVRRIRTLSSSGSSWDGVRADPGLQFMDSLPEKRRWRAFPRFPLIDDGLTGGSDQARESSLADVEVSAQRFVKTSRHSRERDAGADAGSRAHALVRSARGEPAPALRRMAGGCTRRTDRRPTQAAPAPTKVDRRRMSVPHARRRPSMVGALRLPGHARGPIEVRSVARGCERQPIDCARAPRTVRRAGVQRRPTFRYPTPMKSRLEQPEHVADADRMPEDAPIGPPRRSTWHQEVDSACRRHTR